MTTSTWTRFAGWLLIQVNELYSEAERVHVFALSEPRSDYGVFVQTLYAYVTRSFAIIDRLSLAVRPDDRQTPRMVDLLEHRIGVPREQANVAVKLWRHGLMHTGEARSIRTPDGQHYTWLLQWGARLPRDQHWTFAEREDGARVLNLALLYLAEDLRNAVTKYVRYLAGDASLQARVVRAEHILVGEDEFKPV